MAMAAPLQAELRAAPDRDSALDVWRGFALVTIFINHVSGNVLENVTHKNFGFSDAAELFVFFAGYAGACAYFGKYLAGDRLGISLRLLSRAMKLYTTHLALVVLGGAVFAMGVLRTGDTGLFSVIALEPLLTDPAEALVGAVTLSYQPGFLNILPLYFVLIGLLPLLLMMAARSLPVTLALSAALYTAAGLTNTNLPSHPIEGGWFFNPLCWQFLFTIGVVLGARRHRAGLTIPYRRGLYLACCAWLAFALAVTLAHAVPHAGWLPLPDFLTLPQKQNLSLPRLLHVLALAYVVVHSPLQRWARARSTRFPLAMMGRHSLPVFCTGLVVSMAGVALKQTGHTSAGFDIAYVAAGLSMQLTVAWLLSMTEKRRGSADRVGPLPAMVQPS
jgi:hypothetical protein